MRTPPELLGGHVAYDRRELAAADAVLFEAQRLMTHRDRSVPLGPFPLVSLLLSLFALFNFVDEIFVAIFFLFRTDMPITKKRKCDEARRPGSLMVKKPGHLIV